MAKMMMIDTEEGLMTWCKSTGSEVRLQKRGAKIILDYLSGHGKMLSTNPEGELYLNDEHVTEKTTLDDVVDLVCEWNYEALSDTRERKENPDDFLDYCRSCSLEQTLEEHKFILDRIFKQTVYGKDVQTIAHKLALEMMKEMKLVPIYDIPIADEIGASNKVSEKSEYQTESNDENEKSYDADIEVDKEEILTEGNEPEKDSVPVEDNEQDIEQAAAGSSNAATEQEPAKDSKEQTKAEAGDKEKHAGETPSVHAGTVNESVENETKTSGNPEEISASDKEEDNKKEQGRSR